MTLKIAKKTCLKAALVSAVFSSFMGCSSKGPSIVDFEDDQEREDFVLIHASNSSVILGTKLASASINEKPQMKVKFTYDFSIEKHEVTCGEFNETMADNYEDLVNSISCSEDSLPISNVNYLDAVLYANARSKADKLDTAYTYSKATFDKDGHCIELEALSLQPSIEGYRLPTEAEWTFVANQGWSVNDSWTAENSDFEAHDVCSNGKNQVKVCDLSGNLKEWTNDWLGRLSDTTITNFVGATDGGSLGERVIKGGSFRSEKQSINTYSRGDVYSVTSTTASEYLGFRQVIGSIPSPTWLSNNGTAESSPVHILANSATLQKLVGTYKAKLAFRNDNTENLAFVDYASGSLSVTEIRDTLPVFHPEISSNGEKVAFCTKIEGISGTSAVYVRDLQEGGGNLIKLDVESAAIPRWRILSNGDTAIVYVSSAGDNSSDETFKTYSTWQVTFMNGAFGTPQKLFDGNYHDGISSDNSLAVTGSRLLRARIARDSTILDTLWYNGAQACNASLSKDNTKRTAFLDFGGDGYGVHEKLFIADSNGNVINEYSAPANYAIDHSEWADSNTIVVTLTNENEAHVKIAALNLRDSSFTDLLSGDELWHPSLWIRPTQTNTSTSLDQDSAGVYYVSGGSEAAIILRNKMELFWKYRNDAKLAILGSSRSQNGIIPTLLEDSLVGINLSNIPNSIYVSDYLFTNYMLPHLSKLKYVAISLDIDMWWKKENVDYDNFFYKAYKALPGFVYDANHDFWKEGYPEGLLEATHEAYNFAFYDTTYAKTRGSNTEPDASWEESPAVDYDSTWFDKDSEAYYANLNRLESMMIEAEKRGIYLIGIVFPMSPGYKETGSFGRYGIRRSIAQGLLDEIEAFSKKYPHFIFMDENKMGNHDYEDDMASNRDHLSLKGAEKMSVRLDSLIKTLP